jgi:hypothetical protein
LLPYVERDGLARRYNPELPPTSPPNDALADRPLSIFLCPTMPTPPLHEFNPIGRFSDRAADYVKYRPGYPPEAIDAILDGLGPPTALIAADIGAGTGISARLLASRARRGLRSLRVEADQRPRYRRGRAHAVARQRRGTGRRVVT